MECSSHFERVRRPRLGEICCQIMHICCSMVVRRSYEEALNTGHALVTQFDNRSKKGNCQNGLQPL